ncbi:alpha/beta hydrolase [Bifidobacterium catenulatum subsp. catenulatum]|uniref:alpha/beta hydrolase n=1 Tax=Bifidobacterium catenulatum TaxID=1686 RepID=UPI003D3592E4
MFSITAVLAAILLGIAIWEMVSGSRGGGKRAIAVVACPMVIAVIAGIVGLVIAWLLSDVFVVFGVELGPRVIAWAGCGCAIVGFAVSHVMLHRGVLRAVAVILVVCAVFSTATGIDQAYGEYATIGSLFGQDSYREADLTGMAKRSDLISVTQWRQEAADGSISDILAHGEVSKVNIPATTSHFEARQALVYLPPAALVTAKHKPALPVILMMSGQPGSPGRVFAAGGIQTMMDDYAQHHGGLAPIVIAADQLGDDSHNTLCVDSPVYGKALTYLTKDVVDWVKTNLPAARQAQDWAIAGFSQGATCSLQIGANHPNLFGTIIPTGSELKPTNGSESSMISRFFHGDRTAYEKQIPINAIRNHAPSNQTLVIGAGERDRESVRNVELIAPVAQQEGMHVTAVESLGNAHDWHAVQDTLRYGLAVFGYNTGLSDAKPKLADYPNLERIAI